MVSGRVLHSRARRVGRPLGVFVAFLVACLFAVGLNAPPPAIAAGDTSLEAPNGAFSEAPRDLVLATTRAEGLHAPTRVPLPPSPQARRPRAVDVARPARVPVAQLDPVFPTPVQRSLLDPCRLRAGSSSDDPDSPSLRG